MGTGGQEEEGAVEVSWQFSWGKCLLRKKKIVWHLPYYADRVARTGMYKNIYISKPNCFWCSGYIVSNSINYTRLGLGLGRKDISLQKVLETRYLLQGTFLGKISAQPHPTLCIQFLNRENNDKNNTFPLGKQICFTIVWGCAETLPYPSS